MKIGITGPKSTICKYFLQLLDPDWEIVTCDEGEGPYMFEYCKSVDIIINFAAYTDVKNSNDNKPGCWYSNVELVRILIEVCKKQNIPLLHLSTLYVGDIAFNDQRQSTYWFGEYNYYTFTKYMAEQLLFLSDYKKWGIIRTDSIFGKNAQGVDQKFVGKMINLIKSNQIVHLQNIIGIRPTYAKDVAYYIIQLLRWFESDMIEFNKDLFQATNGIDEYELVTLEQYYNEIANILNVMPHCIVNKNDVRYFRANYINSGLRHWKDALGDYITNEFQT